MAQYPLSRTLTRARTLNQALMPDTATNARTSIQTKAFVNDEPKTLTVERGLRLRSYEVDVPYGTDYVAGDTLTLGSTSGTFAVQQTYTPTSYPIELRLICVSTSLKLASYLAVETATFRTPTAPYLTVSAPVYVVDQIADVQEYGYTPAYRWMVVFESSLAYTGGGKVGESHNLALPSLFGTDSSGTARSAPITRPRPVLHALPFMAAFVKEVAG